MRRLDFTDFLYWEKVKNGCSCGTILTRRVETFSTSREMSLQAKPSRLAGSLYQQKASWPESQLPQPDGRTRQKTVFLCFLVLHPSDIFMSIVPSVFFGGWEGLRIFSKYLYCWSSNQNQPRLCNIKSENTKDPNVRVCIVISWHRAQACRAHFYEAWFLFT